MASFIARKKCVTSTGSGYANRIGRRIVQLLSGGQRDWALKAAQQHCAGCQSSFPAQLAYFYF